MAGAPTFWLSNRDDSGGVEQGARGEPASMLQQPTPQWPQQQTPSWTPSSIQANNGEDFASWQRNQWANEPALTVNTGFLQGAANAAQNTLNTVRDRGNMPANNGEDFANWPRNESGVDWAANLSPMKRPAEWVDINDHLSVRGFHFEVTPWDAEMRTFSVETSLASASIRPNGSVTGNVDSRRLDTIDVGLGTGRITVQVPPNPTVNFLNFADFILTEGFEFYTMASLLNIGFTGRSPLNNLFDQIGTVTGYFGAIGGRLGLNWGLSENAGLRGSIGGAKRVGFGFSWQDVERCVE